MATSRAVPNPITFHQNQNMFLQKIQQNKLVNTPITNPILADLACIDLVKMAIKNIATIGP